MQSASSKQTTTDSFHSFVAASHYKPTIISTESCHSKNTPAYRVRPWSGSANTEKIKSRSPRSIGHTRSLILTCCCDSNWCETVTLAASQSQYTASGCRNQSQCYRNRHLTRLVQKHANSKRLRLIRCPPKINQARTNRTGHKDSYESKKDGVLQVCVDDPTQLSNQRELLPNTNHGQMHRLA